MQYTRPTTQAQLHSVLKEIFFYYRIRRAEFEGVDLEPLNLSRMEYAELSNSELLTKAETLNAGEQYEYKTKYIADISEQLAIVNAKLSGIADAKEAKIQKVNDDFDQSSYKLELYFAKNGIIDSSIAIDKITQLETERNTLLAQIESEYQADIVVLNAQKQNLTSKYNGAENYCALKAQKENSAKQKELIDEQEKIKREVFKYNNGLDEKEQRYANNIKEVSASLELRFLDIQSGEFTKDQLVEMGYYSDVIDCVCAYYDTLPTLTAAQQIMNDRKIIEYLDDYYENVIYLYQQRALA